MRHVLLSTAFSLALSCAGLHGQDNAGKQSQSQDLTAAPQGFDMKRDGIDRGKLETVEYDSTTVGEKRKARVYTPPGYTVVIPTDHWGVSIPSGVKSGAIVAVAQQPAVAASAPLLLGADSCA